VLNLELTVGGAGEGKRSQGGKKREVTPAGEVGDGRGRRGRGLGKGSRAGREDRQGRRDSAQQPATSREEKGRRR